MTKRFLPTLLLCLGLAAVYFGAGRLGLSLAHVNPNASAVWPATGLALAACLIFGYRVWPFIWLGAFLTNISTSGAVAASAIIAVGNTLEGVAGAYLVNRFANGRQAFDRAADVFRFAALAGLVAPAISASVGVTTLLAGGLAPLADAGSIWLTWWLGDVAGALVLGPFLVLWARPPQERWTNARLVEAAVLLAVILGLGLLLFGGQTSLSADNYPLAYWLLPVVVWGAYRFGPHGAATSTLLVSRLAVWGTLRSFGPFVHNDPNQSLLLLQGFMVTIAVTGMGLAALSASAARLFQAERLARATVERAASYSARLQAITAALSVLLDPEEVADVIVDHGVVAVGAAAGSLAVLANDDQKLEIIRSSGYPAAAAPTNEVFALDAENPLAVAARKGQPVWLESPAAIAAYDPQLPLIRATNAQAAAALPLTSHGRVLGSLGFSFSEARAFRPEERAFLMALAQQCGQALERTRLYAQAQQAAGGLEERLRDRTVQLRALTSHIETLREAERTRIAREVHDELGGTLTAIKMNIRQVERGLPEVQPDLSQEFESLFELVDDAVQTVRRIATDLRPAVLDDLGLVPAVEWQTLEFTRRTGIPCERVFLVESIDLPHETATAVFRILQEALTNVSRHAQATCVVVALEREAEQLVLAVTDNGQGFAWPPVGKQRSLGLAGMQERVTGIGGTLIIDTAPGRGTTVRVRVPLTETPAAA